ncbi:Ferric reductase like transmembrane component [Ceratobasidium sp. AG-Ba]|nr:Ferric reductase like transmembrane component [Ceratobasidium sp. AG-Ba]
MSTTTSVSLPFSDVHPTQTASVVQSYRPPLATGTGGAVPANTGSATHYAYGDPNPTTPAFIDSYQWINTYLVIHKMSTTSYRYAYMLWLVITLFTLIVTLAHLSSRTTVIGALWRKYSIRRRTWRKQASLRRIEKSKQPHRQPYSLPSNAQLIALILLFVAAALLCCIGPDYVSPYTRLWDLKSNLTAPALARRDISAALDSWRQFDRRAPIASTPTTRQPEYTIPKAWWTAGGRTGIIAFALMPLCVLFALKAPPFALFALPFTTQMHFDKLAFLHRWSGRIIWAITTIHVATWGVQLGRDQRHGINEGIAWDYVWLYPLFIYGIIGYISMTLLVFLSLSPIRTRYYETFYVLHIFLVPLTIIFSALHFPQIWHWCWVALCLWGAERLWRWGRGVWVNGALGPWGSFGAHVAGSARSSIAEKSAMAESWEMGVRAHEGKEQNSTAPGSSSASTFHEDKDKDKDPKRTDLAHYFVPSHHHRDDQESVDITGGKQRPWSMTSDGSNDPVGRTSMAELIPRSAGVDQDSYGPVKGAGISPSKPLFSRQPNTPQREHGVLPPPGFAHCVILPGRTVRLTIVTARPMMWAPGQHVLLCVPGISKFTTHPFTIAGACDASATGVGARGREIVLIIRARAGFTKSLWEGVLSGCNHHQRSKDGRRGLLMRATVDGPFGSSVREKWDKYETALLIAGGSGVAFALSVLEALCLAMVEGRAGSKTKRIRFVWMIREYAHVQWCATILRRCREMVPNRETLQIDIFVTNFASQQPGDPARLPAMEDGSLAPPTPRFLRDGRTNSVVSTDSLESSLTSTSVAEYDYSDGGRGKNAEPVDGPEGDLGTHVLDYTNFDGEEDTRTAAEAQLSKRVKREGRQRRARSRKIAAAVTAKLALEEKRKSVKGFFGMGTDEPLVAPMPRYAHENGSASGSNTPLSASPAGTPRWPQSPLMTPTIPGANLTDSPTLRPPLLPSDPTYRSSVADSMFSRGSVYDDSRSMFGVSPDDPILEMDDDEAEDVNVVAEMARPGKPKLPRILADEVERAGGEIIVACCGPTSLNAAMRKFVADQIDVGKVWRGDMSGSIKLVSEDYEW